MYNSVAQYKTPFSDYTVKRAIELLGSYGSVHSLYFDTYRCCYDVAFISGQTYRYTLDQVSSFIHSMETNLVDYTGVGVAHCGTGTTMTYSGTQIETRVTKSDPVKDKKEKQDNNIKRLAAYRKRKGVMV